MRPAWAIYEDIIYNFNVTGPAGWVAVKSAVVPGIFRFGWTDKSSLSNSNGSTILVFVQLTDNEFSPQEVLDKDIKDVQAHAKEGLKVVSSGLIEHHGFKGFTLDTTGPGTGYFMMDVTDKNHVEHRGKVLTHQHFYTVVRGKTLINIMSTCAEKNVKKFQKIWRQTEASLEVKPGQ